MSFPVSKIFVVTIVMLLVEE